LRELGLDQVGSSPIMAGEVLSGDPSKENSKINKSI